MRSRLGLPQALRIAVACLLLPLHVASCTTWRVETAPIPEVIAAAPERVRLVPHQPPPAPEPAPIVLRHLHEIGDSIVGYTWSSDTLSDSTRMSIPRSTIKNADFHWRPGYARITLKRPPTVRHEVVQLSHPRLVADSIVGIRSRGTTRSSFSVPVASVAHIETGRFDGDKTFKAVLGTLVIGALGAYLFLYLALTSGSDS